MLSRFDLAPLRDVGIGCIRGLTGWRTDTSQTVIIPANARVLPARDKVRRFAKTIVAVAMEKGSKRPNSVGLRKIRSATLSVLRLGERTRRS